MEGGDAVHAVCAAGGQVADLGALKRVRDGAGRGDGGRILGVGEEAEFDAATGSV